MTAASFDFDTYVQAMIRVAGVLWVYTRRDGWTVAP